MRLKTPADKLHKSLLGSECTRQETRNHLGSREYRLNYKPHHWHQESFALGVRLEVKTQGFTDTEFVSFKVFARTPFIGVILEYTYKFRLLKKH